MSEVALGQLLWFAIGALAGAAVLLSLLWRIGALEKKTVVEVESKINVDWSLIESAVRGQGCVIARVYEGPIESIKGPLH